MKFLALAATLVVCATPARAQVTRADPACEDPQTTGSLPGKALGAAPLMGRPARIAMTPPEDSWQEEAREGAERRRREEAEGCPAR
jgi:hypothetical protein